MPRAAAAALSVLLFSLAAGCDSGDDPVTGRAAAEALRRLSARDGGRR